MVFTLHSVGFVALLGQSGGGPGLPAPDPLVLDQEDPAVYYASPFALYSTPNAYAGSLRYSNDATYAEIAVPAPPAGRAAYTTCEWGGYADPNGTPFTASVSGQPVGSGSQQAAGVVSDAVYFTFTGLQTGDVLRLTRPTGFPGKSLLIDRFLFR